MGRPFFSPDGDELGLLGIQDGTIFRYQIDDQSMHTVTDRAVTRDMSWHHVASWGSQDSILFMDQSMGLSLVSANGGAVRVVTTADASPGGEWHTAPQFLPGNRAALFVVLRVDSTGEQRADAVAPPALYAVNLETGGVKHVDDGIAWATYAADHLAYRRAFESTIYAAPFSVSQLSLTGPPSPVLDDASGLNGALAGNGTLLFFEPPSPVPGRLVRVVAGVDASPLVTEERLYRSPRISPDGRSIAVEVQGTGPWDPSRLWIVNVETNVAVPLTDEGNDAKPVWTRDGRYVVFASDRRGSWDLYQRRADGSGATERLLSDALPLFPTSSSSSGTIGYVRGGEFGSDVTFHLLHPDGSIETPLDGVGYAVTPVLSPDGAKVAYLGSEGRVGGDYLFVQFLTDGLGPRRVAQGSAPAWSADGARLFFETGADLQSIEVGHEQVDFASIREEPSWTGRAERHHHEWGWTQYDVFPDGDTFAVILPPVGMETFRADLPKLQVVFNLFQSFGSGQ